MPTATQDPPAKVALAPLPSLEDADLVRRARDGDERAFEEIVRRYRAPLIRYSARHVGRDHAEDVTQHALAKAATHLRDDPRPIHLRAWLYRVAHNAAINMRARKDFGHEELSLEIDGVPQPPELAAQRAEVRDVVSNLDDLPERQRTALLLSVFEGLGYDEIASRLETSPNSVRALLSRARGHLRKAAAALAPLPLLEGFVRKVGAAVGASGSQGTLAAGGSVAQAKLVAVAATVVVGGAATAERAVSRDQGDPGGAGGSVAAAPHVPEAVPLGIDGLLTHGAAASAPDRTAAKAKAEPKADEPPPAPPAPPVEPVVPVDPAPAPPPPAPVVEEASPPAEPAPEPQPEPEVPKEEEHFESEPPADGSDPPTAGGGDPVGYTPAPSGGYRQP